MPPVLKKFIYLCYQWIKRQGFICKQRFVSLHPSIFTQVLIDPRHLPAFHDYHHEGFEQVGFDFGSGNGGFSIDWATKHPSTLVFSLEIAKEFLMKGVKKAGRLALSNVKCINWSGVDFLEIFIADRSLDILFINFPDPWHKKRHNKRRVFTAAFWQLVQKKMSHEGKIYFISDNDEIYSFAFQYAKEVFGMDLVKASLVPDWYPRSKYFRKWEGMGRGINYFEINLC